MTFAKTRPDCGIDAPTVVRNLVVVCAATAFGSLCWRLSDARWTPVPQALLNTTCIAGFADFAAAVLTCRAGAASAACATGCSTPSRGAATNRRSTSAARVLRPGGRLALFDLFKAGVYTKRLEALGSTDIVPPGPVFLWLVPGRRITAVAPASPPR